MTSKMITNAPQMNMDTIRAWVDAVNRNDIEAELACWQPDGEFHIIPTDTTYRGVAEIREGGRRSAMMIGSQPVEGRKQIIHLDAGDDWATVEYTAEATIAGPIAIQGVTILAEGVQRNLVLKACLLFQMKEGKIHRGQEVFDAFSMARQLGLDPEILAKLYAALGSPAEPSDGKQKIRTPEETVRSFIETWNHKDLDGLVALFAEQVVARNPIVGRAASIPKALFRTALQNNMQTFPDLTMRLDRLTCDGETVAIEELESATFTLTGRSYKMPVACFFRVNADGEITEMHNYWDTRTFFEQLGVDADTFMKTMYGSATI